MLLDMLATLCQPFVALFSTNPAVNQAANPAVNPAANPTVNPACVTSQCLQPASDSQEHTIIRTNTIRCVGMTLTPMYQYVRYG